MDNILPRFDPLLKYLPLHGIFYPKGGPFLTTYPPHLVHVVLNDPLPFIFGMKPRRNMQLYVLIQVNLCQKDSFLNQLTHNMTTDCSLNPEFSTRKFQAQNMLCTKIVLNVKTKTKNNVCTQHVLSLEFSCTELGIQWTICRHIVG